MAHRHRRDVTCYALARHDDMGRCCCPSDAPSVGGRRRWLRARFRLILFRDTTRLTLINGDAILLDCSLTCFASRWGCCLNIGPNGSPQSAHRGAPVAVSLASLATGGRATSQQVRPGSDQTTGWAFVPYSRVVSIDLGYVCLGVRSPTHP